MAYHEGAIQVFICMMLLHFSLSSSISVPLLTWTNDNREIAVPVVTAGQTKELSNVYKQHLELLLKSKSVVLVFLQDELSADDFTKYASSFEHLQKVLQKEKYLLFPSVSKGKKSINQLIAGSASEIEYVDSSSLSDWKFKASSSDAVNRIMFFSLEPVSGSHSKGKGEILKRNDLIMHRIIKSIKEQLNEFGVIYTAEDPSPIMADILMEENMEDSSLASRHLLATSKNESRKYFNNSCIMMYVTSIKFSKFSAENSTDLITTDAKWDIGGCGNSGCGISLKRKGDVGGGFSDVTLSISFINDTHQWYCDTIQISGNHNHVSGNFSEIYTCGNPFNASQFSNFPDIHNEIRAPLGMSYACYDLKFMARNGNATSNLTMAGFQVQTMCNGKEITQFSGAFNCVGFFTIEILTGIFVTIILMIGLYVGIMMIMAIQVQDRLDDPKGKSINVPLRSE